MVGKKPELVAPAGNFEKLKIAFLYGADAVYVGGEEFSLRAQAGNFTDEDLAQAATYTHSLGKKLYVAVNVFACNEDFKKLSRYLSFLQDIDTDAVMVTDPGIVRIIKKAGINLPLYLSTQANCTNAEAAKFWQEQGIRRIIPARELSLSEITEMKEKIDIELEIFIHGAVCISYSGRCFISKYLTGRDANRGECTHSCRWEYALAEKTREHEYLPIEEDRRGTYFFYSRDICLLKFIPDLISIGIDAFKIEGRMKSISYVASVVRVYRDVIDTLYEEPDAEVKQMWINELQKVSTRDFTEGFIRGHDMPKDYQPEKVLREKEAEFCGVVIEGKGTYTNIEVRNQFKTGDMLEFFSPSLTIQQMKAGDLFSKREKGITDTVNPNDVCKIKVPFPVETGTIVRRLYGEHGCG